MMEPPPPLARPPLRGSPGPLPRLEILDRSAAKPHAFIKPAKRINDGPDVSHFLVSEGYRDIGTFVLQLNRALCPRRKDGGGDGGGGGGGRTASLATGPAAQTFTLVSSRKDPPSTKKLQDLMKKIEAIIEEAPPDPGPRRFGNVSFRKWHQKLEDRVDELLREHIAPEVLDFPSAATQTSSVTAVDELRSYLLGGFGSAQRLDYGTGHELSFLAFIGCLWKLGAFNDGIDIEQTERSIVLGVFETYLKVIRRLILTYTLEPAGSHGVWGLDDHSFLPYIFGSAQLTRPIAGAEPMPLEGSVLRAPKTADIVKSERVEIQRELNMYFSAVGFISDVKKGPFWEHSPILYDVSGIKDGWGKINKGMIKMYDAEVLSKFPVVQHFPFGSLFSWEKDSDAAARAQSTHLANQPSTAAAAGHAGGSTRMPPPPSSMGPSCMPRTTAPWAQSARGGPGIPYSRVPPAVANTPERQPGGGPTGSTDAQITVTKAPWAKDT